MLRQTSKTNPKIEYCFCSDGSWSCMVLRYKNRHYRFTRGTFIENETFNDPDFFRCSGAVARFKHVEGHFGDEDGQTVQKSFMDSESSP